MFRVLDDFIDGTGFYNCAAVHHDDVVTHLVSGSEVVSDVDDGNAMHSVEVSDGSQYCGAQ